MNQKRCKEAGCERKVSARGLCMHHYQKKWKDGEFDASLANRAPARLARIEAALKRIEEKVAKLVAEEEA